MKNSVPKIDDFLLDYIDNINQSKVISIVGKELYKESIIYPSTILGGGGEKEQLKEEIKQTGGRIEAASLLNSTLSASEIIYKEIEKYKQHKKLYSGGIFLTLLFCGLFNWIIGITSFSTNIITGLVLLGILLITLLVFYFHADRHLVSYEKEFRRLLFLAEKVRFSTVLQSSNSEKWALYDAISIEQAIINTQPVGTQINVKKQIGNINKPK